jgi:hypothetical protein
MRATLSEAEIARLVQIQAVERIVAGIASQENMGRYLSSLRGSINTGTVDAAKRYTLDLPAAARAISNSKTFDILNPVVIEGVRKLNSRVVSSLATETAETIRQAAIKGIEEGIHPRAVARRIRNSIGLAPNQEAATRNFERYLREGDTTALSRKLRDRRFDRTLHKALGRNGTGLTEAQIKRMSEAYRKRMIAFNAETQMRTAANDAQKLGQRLSWEDAISKGAVRRKNLFKRWSGTLDSRERQEHIEQEGEEVHFDDFFDTGEREPGDATYNCRCLAIYFVKAKPSLTKHGARQLPRSSPLPPRRRIPTGPQAGKTAGTKERALARLEAESAGPFGTYDYLEANNFRQRGKLRGYGAADVTPGGRRIPMDKVYLATDELSVDVKAIREQILKTKRTPDWDLPIVAPNADGTFTVLSHPDAFVAQVFLENRTFMTRVVVGEEALAAKEAAKLVKPKKIPKGKRTWSGKEVREAMLKAENGPDADPPLLRKYDELVERQTDLDVEFRHASWARTNKWYGFKESYKGTGKSFDELWSLWEASDEAIEVIAKERLLKAQLKEATEALAKFETKHNVYSSAQATRKFYNEKLHWSVFRKANPEAGISHIKLKIKGKGAKDIRPNVKEGFAWIKKYLHRNHFRDPTLGLASTEAHPQVTLNASRWAGSRARAHPWASEILISKYSNTTTVVHEFGHLVEAQPLQIRNRILEKAGAFWKKRTKGYKPKSLGYAEDPKEWTIEDKFSDPYTGKTYPWERASVPKNSGNTVWDGKYITDLTATEIFSMGLQYMYENPFRFAELDPEFFDFIWDIMAWRF